MKAGDGQAGIREEFCEGSEPAPELRHGERVRQPGLVAIAFKGIVSCDEYLVEALSAGGLLSHAGCVKLNLCKILEVVDNNKMYLNSRVDEANWAN